MKRLKIEPLTTTSSAAICDYVYYIVLATLRGLTAVAGGESWELEEKSENGKGGRRFVRCIFAISLQGLGR